MEQIPLIIETERLFLKILDVNKAPQVLDFYNDNLELFEKYESSRPENFYSLDYQRVCLNAEYNAFLQHQGIRFWVYQKDDPHTIIGTISFLNIKYGSFLSAQCGYKFDSRYHNQGYAFESLNMALKTIFSYCHLHKIEVFIMPENLPSIKLIKKLGFIREGISYDHALIHGRWEDHLRFCRIHDIL